MPTKAAAERPLAASRTASGLPEASRFFPWPLSPTYRLDDLQWHWAVKRASPSSRYIDSSPRTPTSAALSVVSVTNGRASMTISTA